MPQPKNKGMKPMPGAVDLAAKRRADEARAAQEAQMADMAAQMELQKLMRGLQAPWRVEHYAKCGVLVLHADDGRRLIQFGLPDSTRIEFELTVEQVDVLMTMLPTQDVVASDDEVATNN